MSRDDLAALTREAADISGIPYVMDVDKAEVEAILNGGKPKPAKPTKPVAHAR